MENFNLLHPSLSQTLVLVICLLAAVAEGQRHDFHSHPADHGSSEETLISPVLTTPATALSKPDLECVSIYDSTFKFVLSTYRNASGHWIANMDVQHGEGTKATEEHPFEVHLEHKTETCATCEDPAPVYARVSVTEPPAAAAPAAGGYRFFPGYGYYKRHQRLVSWNVARQTCKSEGTDLVVINSDDEAKLLLELSAPMLFLQPADQWNAEAYVGIYDFHHEGNFLTVTGLPLNESGYVNWSPDEPNNFREEDCVTIVRNAMYNDVKCSELFEFICELPIN